MNLRENKIYLYLGVIAAASWVLLNLAGLNGVSRSQQPQHSPDYFSKSYVKWEMNPVGTLKNKLLADKMTHYSDDHTTHFDKPVFWTFSEQRDGAPNSNMPSWIIVAERGLLSGDGKNLLLNGKVTVDRAATTGVRPVQINTFNLKVKPETSYAETDEWAELVSSPNRTTGTGMKLVYTQPVRLELLSHVQGKYEKQ